MFSWSSRGQLCLSGQDKRSLQTLSFFDSNLDVDQLNNAIVASSPLEMLMTEVERDYKMEDDSEMVSDISALMLHRYEAGYRLDRLKRNEQLASRFNGFQRQFSHKSREAQLMQGVKVFWQWLNLFPQEA